MDVREERGLVIPLDDQLIVELLRSVGTHKRGVIDEKMRQLISEIWLS